ncbi:MAG: hypothetical protein ABW252_26220 [Polyangiales bacterium]
MKPLVVFLLRLLVQLVLFAVTGRWYELGRPAQPKPQVPRPKQPGSRRERTFKPDKQAARARASRAPRVEADLAPEGTYRDPESPVLEGGVRRARGVRGARAVRGPVAATSLRAALTDRRLLRDALILDAALGTRGRRH